MKLKRLSIIWIFSALALGCGKPSGSAAQEAGVPDNMVAPKTKNEHGMLGKPIAFSLREFTGAANLFLYEQEGQNPTLFLVKKQYDNCKVSALHVQPIDFFGQPAVEVPLADLSWSNCVGEEDTNSEKEDIFKLMEELTDIEFKKAKFSQEFYRGHLYGEYPEMSFSHDFSVLYFELMKSSSAEHYLYLDLFRKEPVLVFVRDLGAEALKKIRQLNSHYNTCNDERASLFINTWLHVKSVEEKKILSQMESDITVFWDIEMISEARKNGKKRAKEAFEIFEKDFFKGIGVKERCIN